MASNLGDILVKVETRIQDTAKKLVQKADLTGDIAEGIKAALERYSKDRPRERAIRVQGTGAFRYGAAAVLTGYVVGFSSVMRVAYPHVTTDAEPAFLEDGTWEVRLDYDDVAYLVFKTATPSASEYFAAWYTAPHTLNATTCTIPALDDEAFADLAAAEAFYKLAARFVQTVDGSVDADVTDRRTRADIYRSLGKDFEAKYRSRMQGGDTPLKAASYITELDRTFGDGVHDHFFHGRAVN
jgi:hypothetical protein